MRVQLLVTAGVLLLAITPSSADSSLYSITADSVIKHISVLAHDSLEGREVGETEALCFQPRNLLHHRGQPGSGAYPRQLKKAV